MIDMIVLVGLVIVVLYKFCAHSVIMKIVMSNHKHACALKNLILYIVREFYWLPMHKCMHACDPAQVLYLDGRCH